MTTTHSAAKKAPATKRPAAVKKAVLAKKVAAPAPAHVVVIEPTKARPKDKLVRDSFTMPRSDFELIALLKERALTFKRPTKKSELLRAGLQALAALNQKQLQTALDSLPLLKSGRPKKLPPAAKAVGIE